MLKNSFKPNETDQKLDHLPFDPQKNLPIKTHTTW